MIQLIVGLSILAYSAIVIAVSVGVWIYIFQQVNANKPILEVQPAPPVSWGLFDILGGTFGLIVLVNILALAAFGPRRIDLQTMTLDEQATFIWIDMVAKTVVCLTILALILVRGGKMLLFEKSAWQFFQHIKIGGLAFCALNVPVMAIQIVAATLITEYKHPLIEMMQKSPQPGILIPLVISIVLIGPLAEEFAIRLVFQGFVEDLFAGRFRSAFEVFFGRAQSSETEKFDMDVSSELTEASQSFDEVPTDPSSCFQSPRQGSTANIASQTDVNERPQMMVLPILISSFVFAILHWGHGAAPIPLFFLALGLGYLYQKTRSLTPCVVVHMLLNGQTTALLLLHIFFGDALKTPPV